MKTQIVTLLLFALRTVSSQNVNIPPAPTLPDLDVSSFPDYMQRLLAKRPSIIYVNKPNHHEASNQNGNISSDHMNTPIPGENSGLPRTNVMDPINNRRHSLDEIKNVQSKPLFLPQGLSRPHTYGMNLRGDKGEIWNDISGTHLYINDFAPSKSIHPNLLHNKEDEPKSVSTNNNVITPKHNNDYNQKLSVTIKPATMYTTSSNLPKNFAKIGDQKEQYKQQFPLTITTEKSEMATTLIPEINKITSEEIPSTVVRKDKTVNQLDENPSKLTRDLLYYMSPQSLSEEISAIVDQKDNSAANPTVNESITEIQKENIVNTSENDKVEPSFNNISANVILNKEIMNNLSPKTFGMKLIGDHGFVWNDLIKPGIHYNVGDLETTDSTTTTEEEMNSFDSTNIAEEPSIEITKPETSQIYNPTTEANNTNGEEKLSKNNAPESGAFLKMYIEKLVKEEVAKRLELNNPSTDAYRNNGSENKTPIANVEDKTGENHYGSLIGNGKVTNIFVFYPNDKNIKSTVDDNTILSKPVTEILNDMLKNNINSNEPDETNILTAELTESPDMTITTESIKQDNNSNKDKGIEKYKDNETTTQSTAVTSEVSVATVDSTAIDIGNQTTQTITMLQDDATKAKTSESSTVTATESSQDDITNSTVTDSNSKDSSTQSSLQETDNNNETKQAKSVSNEEAGSTTNAEEFNIANDSVNSSIGTSNEDVDKSSNETQANKEPELSTSKTNVEESNITNGSINSSIGTSNEDIEKSSNEPQATLKGKQANEEAELTTISNSDEIDSTVTSKDNVTSEGTTTAKPAENITINIDSVNDSSDVKDDSDAASSDITLPNSDS